MKGLKVGQVSDAAPAGLGTRDAFHIPGIRVCASVDIEPGAHLLLQSRECVVLCTREERTGIADPFIPSMILAGQVFWLFLEPGLVTNLVHNFDVQGFQDFPDLNVDDALPDEDLFYEEEDDGGCDAQGCM